MKRFTKAKLEVGHLSDDALLMAANGAVRPGTPFAFSISKTPPGTFPEFLARAKKYINAEAGTSKKPPQPKPQKAASGGAPLKRQERKRPAGASGEEMLKVAKTNVIATRDATAERSGLVDPDMTPTTSWLRPLRRST